MISNNIRLDSIRASISSSGMDKMLNIFHHYEIEVQKVGLLLITDLVIKGEN